MYSDLPSPRCLLILKAWPPEAPSAICSCVLLCSSRFWGGNFSEAGNHVFACLRAVPGAKGPWFGWGPRDAPAIADVCWSWESTARKLLWELPPLARMLLNPWHLLGWAWREGSSSRLIWSGWKQGSRGRKREGMARGASQESLLLSWEYCWDLLRLLAPSKRPPRVLWEWASSLHHVVFAGR